MGAISRYISDMIPYMIITVPVYLIARFIFLKTKKI